MEKVKGRRIVLVDQEETPSYLRYYGCGLGSEIYTLQSLNVMPEEQLKKVLTIGEGDAVMLVGGEPFRYLRQYYHYGVRNENFFDCSKLRRLSIEGGAFVKCVTEFPDEDIRKDFLSPEFTEAVRFPDFKQHIIHTFQNAMSFIDHLDEAPLDEYYGFDYEGSGMPLDMWYELSGASISSLTEAGFISFTDIRHQLGGSQAPEYMLLLKRLGEFLLKRMDHMVVFNLQYEFQVSNRMLGVDLYNLVDAGVVNVMDGNHEKKYSLKWTAQNILQVNTWDTEFDRISDLIDSMLFTIEGKLKKDQHKVLKVTQENFTETEEWAELCRRYPDYVDEFHSLILEYWGNAFMCIPSEILGYYCNLDAFHTLLIFKAREKTYSKDCWNVNLDNARLGARLMSCGLYIDEPFRKRYEKYCHQMMAWGITYCAAARCWIKMEKHKKLANNIKRYNPTAQQLLRENKFFRGDAVEIVKNLMADNLDTMEATETGLNEGRLVMKYGNKFALAFIDIVSECMKELKMKTKIDAGIVRKKKILGMIAERSQHILGLDQIKLGPKHIELEKYMYYETAYNELQKIWKRQLTSIHAIPDKIFAFGQEMNLLEYSDFISDNYFKCKSPQENDEIAYELTILYRYQAAYLGAMLESTQQLPETDKFYSSRGIVDINDGFNEFMEHWERYYKTGERSDLYPNKVFDLALKFFKCPKKTKDPKKSTEENTEWIYELEDKLKEVWTDFAGFQAQAQYFPGVNDQYVEYSSKFKPEEMDDMFFFMRKLTINYLLYKKYAKLNSTYVGSNGMFKKNNRYVIENEHHIPLRYADPNEPGAVEKCFVKYQVNEKSSKRWSSGFHTIISHGDCKDVLCPPPAWDEDGNIIYGGSNQILTYFDINKTSVA